MDNLSALFFTKKYTLCTQSNNLKKKDIVVLILQKLYIEKLNW